MDVVEQELAITATNFLGSMGTLQPSTNYQIEAETYNGTIGPSTTALGDDIELVSLYEAINSIQFTTAGGAAGVNYVDLFNARGTDPENPGSQFGIEIELVLDGLDPADVSGVDVEMGDGLTLLTLDRFFDDSTVQYRWTT